MGLIINKRNNFTATHKKSLSKLTTTDSNHRTKWNDVTTELFLSLIIKHKLIQEVSPLKRGEKWTLVLADFALVVTHKLPYEPFPLSKQTAASRLERLLWMLPPLERARDPPRYFRCLQMVAGLHKRVGAYKVFVKGYKGTEVPSFQSWLDGASPRYKVPLQGTFRVPKNLPMGKVRITRAAFMK
ncbi:hypothetical protein BABINDRAFT_153883 [Babjeviella inositovora NRRL Y-12698]|uniref:Uncharacterized protein n=1 Tax=Babjeviella inositovora NRRL Y-12698 TaxID=984486 RepID=A0A1E3QMA8_9ASCO|nr:uncharacterized protein BABINDRAFT_153883 [Babjeviella inositovora NRRL Y-12698]ODQ78839.1 hypothetical protein BABINDRAFT_153883 [Babjeviella inositovora NRRL Y-12698]